MLKGVIKRIHILCFLFILNGQDTLTVMSYNVLRFDGNTTTRAAYLKKTMDYVRPDVVMFQEIEHQSGIDLLLNNVFNIDSTVFAAGPLPSNQYMKSGMIYQIGRAHV